MKRLFTLAIVAMIATLSFAQAPVQTKKAVSRQIEKVVNVKALNQKAQEMKVLEAKANAAQETSTSVIRKAPKTPTVAPQQKVAAKALANAQVSNRQALQPRFVNVTTDVPMFSFAGKLSQSNEFMTHSTMKKAPRKAAPAAFKSAYKGNGEKYSSGAWAAVSEWDVYAGTETYEGENYDVIYDILPPLVFSNALGLEYTYENGVITFPVVALATYQSYLVYAMDYSDYKNGGSGAIVLELAEDGTLSIPEANANHIYGVYAASYNEETYAPTTVAGAFLQCAGLEYTAVAEAGTPVEVTKDDNGIITAVTGDQKAYTRAGTAYYVSGQSMYYGEQDGVAIIVEDGNDVYIKNPVSRYSQNTWVKGTKEGNTIVVPAKQPLAYSSSYSTTISLRWGAVTTEGSIAAADDNAENFVFAIDGDKLTLQGTQSFEDATEDAYFMGAFWDDDDSPTGYGDAETVLTYDPTYVAPSTDLVVLPQGAEVADWYMNAKDDDGKAIKNQKVQVAYVGNDVYVKGLIADFADSWVKGTIDGTTATFAKGQYLGDYSTYNIWFMGYDEETSSVGDATATISADKKTITFDGDFVANAKTDALYYLAFVTDAVLTAEQAEVVEPIITELTATLPYVNGFDTEAEQAEAAIYDANDDGSTFTFANDSKTSSTTARYKYNSSNAGDDYVVFPGVALEAGKPYNVSVDARAYGDTYPEKLEVVVGTIAKASQLTTVVIPATQVGGDYQTLSASFSPETAGTYYFAIHAVSDADMFYLYTDNFSVKANDVKAPKAVADLTATADPTAALKATVNFTAPTEALDGSALENVTYTLTRDGEAVKSETVAAGTKVEVVDEAIAAPGTVTYAVGVAAGEHIGDAVSVKVYVGEDIPNYPLNFDAEDKSNKVAMAWDPVTTGLQGGIIIPENIKYNLYPVVMEEFWGMQFPTIDTENPYALGVTDTNYTLEIATNEGAQGYTYFGIKAENAAGESNGAMDAALTGAPYDLPIIETFANGGLDYWWGTECDEDNYEADGGLGLSDDNEFVFNAKTAGYIDLFSGKINIAGASNPTLSLEYKGAGAMTLTAYGPEKSITKTLTPGAEYAAASMSLSELASEPWIRFTVEGTYTEAGQAYVKNISVMDLLADNVKTTIVAPAKVVAGQSALVTVIVKNEGMNKATGYTVKVYANDDVLAEFAADETDALEFLETAQYTATLETTIFDEAGDVTLRAEVDLAGDEKPADNADEVVITVVAPSATPVESVSVVKNNEGVEISWTVAANAAKEVTEDFESYDEFAIVANGETLGDWTGWDVDGGKMYGWNSGNWPHAGTTSAFGIYNENAIFETGENGGYESAQAAMFMAVTPSSSTTGANDDWMVSPMLPGIAQTIKFMLTELTSDYGNEKYQVLASYTGNTVDCFTVIASGEASTDWTEVSVDLPAGTKYFAIRCLSSDAFVMLVDNITYMAGGGAPTGFNVYIDQVQIASVDADATSYQYKSKLPAGSHTASVTAVYGNTESAPVSATFGTTTGIEDVNEAQSVEIYTIDGIRMNNAKNIKSGVYVVNGKKLVIK